VCCRMEHGLFSSNSQVDGLVALPYACPAMPNLSQAARGQVLALLALPMALSAKATAGTATVATCDSLR
jgi:hypothetical protein